MAKITKGNITFSSKAKIINFLKMVLNQQDHSKFLSGSRLNVVLDVFKDHQDYDTITQGLPYDIGVRRCHVNPRNNQFYIMRIDGTTEAFSYMTALTPKSKLRKVKEALRYAIKEQTIAFKENYFAENATRGKHCVCPVTKLKITKKNSHLDHYPVQFDEIVDAWLKEYNLDFNNFPTYAKNEAEYISDESLLDSFRRYHAKVAKYRVVLALVNQQREKAKGLDFNQ